jgi:hypothetical protein
MPPWNAVRSNHLQHLDFLEEEFVEMMQRTMDLLPQRAFAVLRYLIITSRSAYFVQQGIGMPEE